jgi:hypothetical protein
MAVSSFGASAISVLSTLVIYKGETYYQIKTLHIEIWNMHLNIIQSVSVCFLPCSSILPQPFFIAGLSTAYLGILLSSQ